MFRPQLLAIFRKHINILMCAAYMSECVCVCVCVCVCNFGWNLWFQEEKIILITLVALTAHHTPTVISYRGADKSLARTGKKHATATEDFEFHIPYL
jgi:hypothetical protein